MRNPKVGMFVKVKPDKAVEPGLLPVELAANLRLGSFEIIKCQPDKSGKPGSALKMPDGIGESFTVNGRQQWAWFVYDDDIAEEEEEKKGPKAVSAPYTFKAGDIVKSTYLADLGSRFTDAENKKGFRILGADGSYLVIEVPEGKGELRDSLGRHTLKIRSDRAALVKEFKFEKGAWVKVKYEHQAELSGRLNAFDHNQHGFRILEIRGTKAVLEMPPDRACGVTDSKHPGKLVHLVELSKLEGAIPLQYRRGDKIRIKSEHLPYSLTEQQKRQKMEIVEVSGYIGSLEYTVKLPNGQRNRYSEGRCLHPNKEAKVNSKFKKGMKVKVQEAYLNAELPDSMSDAAKRKAFEVLEADEYDDQVLIKVPNNIDEADESEEYGCRVWYVGKAYLEENTKMSKRNRDGVERSDMGFGERLAANAEKGAVRTVGRKLVCAVKAGILRALEASAKTDKMSDEQIASGLAMFTRFMESQLGNAMISASLGIAIQQLGPQLAQYIDAFADDRVQDLADDMQAEGVAIVMEKVIDTALEHILPEVGEVMKGLPPKKKTKVRVATETAKTKTKRKLVKVGNVEAYADVEHHGDSDEEEDEEEEEEIKLPARHAKAA